MKKLAIILMFLMTIPTFSSSGKVDLDNSNPNYLVILEEEIILSKVKFTRTLDAMNFCASEGDVMIDDPQKLYNELVTMVQISIYLTEQSFSYILDIISYDLATSSGVWVIASGDRVVQWYDGKGYDFDVTKITELQRNNPSVEVAAPAICFSQALIDELEALEGPVAIPVGPIIEVPAY